MFAPANDKTDSRHHQSASDPQHRRNVVFANLRQFISFKLRSGGAITARFGYLQLARTQLCGSHDSAESIKVSFP